MPTLKELYTALREDGAPVPDTYDKFHDYMTSGPGNGYEHRREVYEALKEDGAPLPSTYEEFSRALFTPANAGQTVGKQSGAEPSMNTAAAAVPPIPGRAPSPAVQEMEHEAVRYEERQRGGETAASPVVKAQASGRKTPAVSAAKMPVSTPERQVPGGVGAVGSGLMDAVARSAGRSVKRAEVASRAGEMMRSYRLRRGGKDFDVPESEVMFYGGFDKWAQSHKGAPVRVYMRHRDGRRVHVPVSQVSRLAGEGWWAEARRDEPRLPSESGAAPRGGRPVTAADKAYYAHQLADVVQDSRASTRAGQQRVEGMTDYLRNGEALTGAAVDDGMHMDPSDGQVKKRYLLPTGERTFDAAEAESVARAYRVEIGRQREEARQLQHPEYEELVARRDAVWKEIREMQAKRGEAIDKGSEGPREGESAWDAFVRIAGGASARANDTMHAHPTGKEAGISGKPAEERMKQLWAELLELDAAVRRVEQATKYQYNLDKLGGVPGTVENFGEGMLNTLLDPDTLTMGVTGKSRESELSAAQAAGADPDAGRLLDSSMMSASAMRDVGKLGAMDTGATVAGFFADPLVWATGGVGGAAGRGVTRLMGKSLLKGGTRAMAARAGASQLSARLLPKMAVGAAHGAGTFGAYEGASALRDQIVHGGYVNPETGENEGYSLLPILNSTAHGVVMGGLTGGAGAFLGNVADRLVRASGTAGKMALRGAEAAVSTVAEGTIFSIPEWIEGKRDAMDVWTDNLEMVAGFKAVGAVKGAPSFIRSLREIKPGDGRPLTRAEREHNNLSFMERLDRSLNRYGDAMAFTQDELAEMRRYGYGDFSELFKRRKDAASQQGGTPGVPDLPGVQAERVQHPELDNYGMMERFVNDKRVSQAARAKAYFILTGRGLPMSTVTGYESARMEDGGHVVNAVAGDGEVVTSRTFGSEGDAKGEIEKIERQVELNTVDVGEKFRESEAAARALDAAYADVAARQGGMSAEMVRSAYEQAVRDLTDPELAESSRRALEDLVKEVEAAIQAHADDFAASTPEAIRRDVEAEYNVTIDAALRKRSASRSAAEKEALQDYVERLFPVEAREGAAEAAAPEQRADAGDAAEAAGPGQNAEASVEVAGAEGPEVEERPIGRAVMKYQDRPVEVMSGRVVMTDDGAMVDRERSDATVVVRDAETGKVEMVSPEAILTYEDYTGDEAAVPADAVATAEAVEQNSDASVAEENRGVAEAAQTAGPVVPEYGVGDSFRVKVSGSGETLPAAVVDSEGERVMIWTYSPIGEASEKTATMPGYLTDVTRGELDGMLERDAQGNPVKYVRAQDAVAPSPEGTSTKEELADRVVGPKTPSAPDDSVGSAALTADLGETEEAMSATEPVEARIPKLSTEERDEYGKPMVLAKDGTTTFGVVESESGLAAAPIRLSLGENSVGQDGKNHGYGLLHIEAGHGDQIRTAGFESVVEFVESVAKNYSTIREGGVIAGNQTYLLEVPDGHNNTLFIQLSKDGKYWNVNSAGIFKEKYSRRKPKVYDVPALGDDKGTDTTGVNSGHDEGATAPAGNSPETFGGKGSDFVSDKQGNGAESSEDSARTAALEQRAEAELTALERIPRDEKNEPVFEMAESPEAGWDALVEFSEGDAATAKEIADTMAEEKRKAYEKAQKQKPKGKTPIEILASKKAISAGLAQAEQEYDMWRQMAGVEQRRQEAARAEQRAREEAERAERAALAKADKELAEAYDEVKGWPEAVERLQQTEPETMDEAAALVLSRGKLLWGDAGGALGMASETGLGTGERRKLFRMFATADNGGRSIGYLAGDPMREVCADYGIPYDEAEARDALIGVLRGASVPSDVTRYIERARVGQAREMARYLENERENFYRDNYHMGADEYEDYEEALLEEMKNALENFDESEYNANIAEEIAQRESREENGHRINQEDDASAEGADDGGGSEVLPGEEAAERRGAGEDARGREGSGRDGDALRDTQGGLSAGAPAGEGITAGNRFDRSVPSSPEAQRSAISRIIEIARKVKNRVERVVIGGITKRQAKDFADNGIEVDETWVHSFESSAVTHNQKHHGNEAKEASRGQVAITEEDYVRIPDILENYDRISKSPNITKGTENEVIIYEKEFGDGYVYYLEEKRDNRKSLAFHTMYKKKKGTDSSDGFAIEPTAPITPVAPSDNLSSISDRKGSDSASEKQGIGAESSLQPSDNKGVQTIQTAVEAASAQVNTAPTPAQAEAGNYKKGHVTIGEFDITIENPAGSVRKGVDADGKEWSTQMANTYGYIKGTEGVDGDHIDVFLHENMDEWNGRKVFVVDQTNTDGSFDEHKVMLGFNDKNEAMTAYLANYDKTWADTHPGLRISETNIEDFNKWVQSSHRKTKPFAEYSTVSKVVDDAPVKTEPQQPEPSETPAQPAATIEGEGYKIQPKPYTNKQGKTLDTYLVTFDRDFSKEELSALRAKAKALKGWYDRESKGWMLRSSDDAKAFADEVAAKSEDEVADEAPLSMADMEKTNSVPRTKSTAKSESPIKQVDVEGVFDALKTKGETKLSDHAAPVGEPKPKKRRWISDEDADEFDSLRKDLRCKI